MLEGQKLILVVTSGWPKQINLSLSILKNLLRTRTTCEFHSTWQCPVVLERLCTWPLGFICTRGFMGNWEKWDFELHLYMIKFLMRLLWKENLNKTPEVTYPEVSEPEPQRLQLRPVCLKYHNYNCKLYFSPRLYSKAVKSKINFNL